jgi:SAM-dependent methyltransferase
MTRAALYESLAPLLRHALGWAGLPPTGRILDLASGAGDNHALLAEACPGARIIALDWDGDALRRAEAAGSVREREAAQQSVHCAHRRPRSRARPRGAHPLPLCADAHALPLRDGCLDGAVCIAALGLFAAPLAALAELRRALRPGGRALVVTATQRWAEIIPWPDTLAQALGSALTDDSRWTAADARTFVGCRSSFVGDNGPSPADQAIADALRSAGFVAAAERAFLLGGPPDPLLAELPLLPWAALRPRAARQLPAAALACCDAIAAAPEIELCTLALVAVARV